MKSLIFYYLKKYWLILWIGFVALLVTFSKPHEPQLTIEEKELATKTWINTDNLLKNQKLQKNLTIEYYDHFRTRTQLGGQILNGFDLLKLLKNNDWAEIPVNPNNDTSLCRNTARTWLNKKIQMGETLNVFCKNAVLFELIIKQENGSVVFFVDMTGPR